MAKTVKKPAVAATGSVLELKGISRWYGEGVGKVDVLKGVNLAIPAGKSVAIVGPSGSGKSTLLHVAGLLDRPDAGEVLVGGMDVAKLNDDNVAGIRNASCGFVYQFHHLLREFTALENVFLPMTIGGKKPDMARGETLLKAVGLGHRMGHYPSQMSGGEQQRVAIARALMNQPKLLLADEPTGNLDPHTADEVVDMLFGLIADEGMSALIVTHNMELAGKCDLVYRMDEGHLAKA
ncbi:MAG: ABC transporter ATP-binding protein [Blastochloris viridis]|uniref:ABC transporter ATP-binding protein n=1 Tax=Blastochloris viridis TaxID=1079 RepID=A0A6N4R9K2_BLAVI|nr:MAG: ABC transporter ATP-binding protein [Blastochloris viridis]